MVPTLPGIDVLGGSSDHTILDITECPVEIKTGDILEFEIRYTGGVYATNSPNFAIEYVGKE